MAFKNINEMEKKESEFWNPQKDDELQGNVVVIKEGNYGKQFLVIEDDDENVFITTQCASLDYLISRARLEIGDYVKVVYLGRANDEYQSHKYELYVWEEEEE